MTSTFTWMDHSETQRRRMLEVIATFREQDTVDELGIGSVRDALSETLVPGTSVLLTRARYLLLVPWICQGIEEGSVPAERGAQRLRHDEVRLIHALLRSGESLGVIGGSARERTQRLPSALYWGALGRYGIRVFPGTVAQWQRGLRRSSEPARLAVADDGTPLVDRSRNWHATLPSSPPGYLEDVGFALTDTEAEYLRERILATASTSFLAHVLVSGLREHDADFAWNHPAAQAVNPAVGEHLQHARNFSEVMHGASLLYNLILAERANQLRSRGGDLVVDDDLTDRYRLALAEWSQRMDGRSSAHEEWERGAFWSLVTGVNERIPFHTRAFVDAWMNIALQRADAVATHEPARALVSNRERQIKRRLARVSNDRQLERWSGASGTAQLDFRWSSIRLMIDDIVVGLTHATERVDAGA